MITFLITYLNGEEFLNECLKSIRKFHPKEKIIIASKYPLELDKSFNAQVLIDESDHVIAMQNLAKFCPTDIGVFIDHDCVLLNNIDYLAEKIYNGDTELIGFEEVLKAPPEFHGGYLRHSPGFMPMTFLMFNIKRLAQEHNYDWWWDGKYNAPNSVNHEGYWGLCQKYPKHLYLTPYNTVYGLGNLFKDGDKDILYHQWYGSYRVRVITPQTDGGLFEENRGGSDYLAKAELRFLYDWKKGEPNFKDIILAK